jgi:hypothetical protein
LAPAGIAPPTGPAGPTALEAHERVGGHAATRQSVLVRAVIASYTQPTQIEIPIPIDKYTQRVCFINTRTLFCFSNLSDEHT